ncbi:LuxR C-terminal-related transcriptional regulator [Actinoplanes sp. G11-F43]|uniref:LuxR C-terminal-related transcriptional regulator n=1 Tax=Actinoplanes sp. G11-F43 TaxID=3424130 RepID=UPI003D32A0BA
MAVMPMGGLSLPVEDEIAGAYALLLRAPGLDLPEFAARIGRTVAEARDLLDRMVDLALLHRRPSENGSLIAASPVLAMQQLMAREQQMLAERQAFLQQGYTTLSQVLTGYVAGEAEVAADPAPIAEQLPDLPAVRRRLEELALVTRDEVLSFSPRAGNPAAAKAASRPLDFAALERGVRMRTIYSASAMHAEGAREYAEALVEAGGAVRIVPVLPVRLIAIDAEVAVVPRQAGTGTDGGLLIRHPGTVTALVALFDSYWERAEELSQAGIDDCTEAERAVLRLLSTGAKDEAVARQVNQSVRTVRRTIADLMTRLHANSRFELAIRAGERGWL